MNAATGYTIFDLFTSRERLSRVDELVIRELRLSLRHEGFPENAVEEAVRRCGKLEVRRTEHRRALGYLNDIIRGASMYFEQWRFSTGVPTNAEFAAQTNRGVHGPKTFPLESMAAPLGVHVERKRHELPAGFDKDSYMEHLYRRRRR